MPMRDILAHGPLYPQAALDRSFERGESSYSGLAMVRAVVKQHGGSLEIESEPGEGTYAQIRIPLRD